MSSLTFAPGDGDANVRFVQEPQNIFAADQRFEVGNFIAIILNYKRTVGGDTHGTLLKLINAPRTTQEIKDEENHGTCTSDTDPALVGVMISPSSIAATNFNHDNLIIKMRQKNIDTKQLRNPYEQGMVEREQGRLYPSFDLNSLSTFIDALALHAAPHQYRLPEDFDLGLVQKAIYTACILLGYNRLDEGFAVHDPENERNEMQALCANIVRRASNI